MSGKNRGKGRDEKKKREKGKDNGGILSSHTTGKNKLAYAVSSFHPVLLAVVLWHI